MEPVLILIPGILGGLLFALLALRFRRAGRPDLPIESGGPRTPPTDVINMAHIRVAGVGGLGLVAMAAAVALDIPRIGLSVGTGLVLGAAYAAIVVFRSRREPMPGSRAPGANAVLSIDLPEAAGNEPRRSGPDSKRVQAVPRPSALGA
jgi:hypothetical protein